MLALAVSTIALASFAAVTAEEAKQLGQTLTAWGAEKSGNKDGTIPEYTGETIKVPADFDPKKPGNRPEPWSEKPVYSITAQKPQGCYGGLPFPIPKTGAEVMWNHMLTYEGLYTKLNTGTWVVGSNEQPVDQVMTSGIQYFPFFDPSRTAPAEPNSPFWKVRVDSLAPTPRVGEKLVVIDALDTTRRAYQCIPGQRRVKLAPDLAYDTPMPFSGGASTQDDVLAPQYGDMKRLREASGHIVHASKAAATACRSLPSPRSAPAPDRTPELLQLLSDTAWLEVVMLFSSAVTSSSPSPWRDLSTSASIRCSRAGVASPCFGSRYSV